ncbi:hypothetical protein DFJ73DRAFT_852733 [Zopfochytrium polystomum]|nr:hypothetical protein DFJ73DRAFT_852733 [Zopfochytrium polystomum]
MALTLKVSYRGTLRSILTTTPAEATTWSSFDARIRKAFAIPAEVPLAVTYVDADGDQIAIDSDEELAELLRLFGGSGKSVRFEVRTVQGDEYVVVGAASERGTSPTASVAEQPRVVSEPVAQSGPVAASAPVNETGLIDFNVFALQEEYEKSNMGPILEKIAEEAQTAFTPAFEELLRARHNGPRSWGATGGCHPAFSGRCGPRSFNPHPFGRFHHPAATTTSANACFGNVEQVHGGVRGAGGVSHAERFVTMVHPVDRVEEEAVETLRGMGFEESQEERVVELLVRERETERGFDVAV